MMEEHETPRNVRLCPRFARSHITKNLAVFAKRMWRALERNETGQARELDCQTKKP